MPSETDVAAGITRAEIVGRVGCVHPNLRSTGTASNLVRSDNSPRYLDCPGAVQSAHIGTKVKRPEFAMEVFDPLFDVRRICRVNCVPRRESQPHNLILLRSPDGRRE